MKILRNFLAGFFSFLGFLWLAGVSTDPNYINNSTFLMTTILLIIPQAIAYMLATRKLIMGSIILVFIGIIASFAEPFFWEGIRPYAIQLGLSLILIVVLVIGIETGTLYNSLIQKDEDINKKLGDLEVVYQLRIDKIASLSQWVDRYLSYEQSTFQNISQIRSGIMQANDPNTKIKNIDNLEKSYGSLMLTMEAYPNLKSDVTVSKIMSEISQTEGDISQKRNSFNEVVKNFNNSVRSFPLVVFASSLNLRPKEYFKVSFTESK